MTIKTRAPLPNKGETGAEKTSDGFRMDRTSSIRLFGVITFLIVTVNTSKKPVEKTKETRPINVIVPPTIKAELIYESNVISLK